MTDSPARSPATLLFFTATYPYGAGAERNFLRPELPYLLSAFERVVLVPERPSGDLDPDFDHRAEVDDSYAGFLRSHGRARTFLRGLWSRLVFAELQPRPWLLSRPVWLKRLLFFAGQAELTSAWLNEFLHRRELAPAACMLYTYWFDQGTLGIGLAKGRFPELRAISRAHGYDVYEERQPVPYFPCREAALRRIDRLFSVSDAGTRYLRGRYPRYSSKIETDRLGVEDPGVLTSPSTDGVFRIVSCSQVVPVKRLPLMLQGIRTAAARRPMQKFLWSHLGNGSSPELDVARQHMPANLDVQFIPYTSQAALFEYYRGHCVDVFLNVSASEGTPVSIMEAISCGIPVIASAVGGNPEVVSDGNGCLIAPNPSPDQIADALLASWDDPGPRRLGSRELWARKYDAARNYSDFVNRLAEIRQ